MNNIIIKIRHSVVVLLAVSFLNTNISVAATVSADKKTSNKASLTKSSVSKKSVSKKSSSFRPSYLLGAGDVLRISVWKEEGLQQEVLVRPDGGITFPLSGELKAGGKTTAQIERAIVSSLKRFIPDPVVTVSVVQVLSNHIYVIGKVQRPTDFTSPSYINVMQALAMVGGLTSFAKPGDIKILRRINGKEVAIPFDYDDVASGENLKQNIILKNGDVVVVP